MEPFWIKAVVRIQQLLLSLIKLLGLKNVYIATVMKNKKSHKHKENQIDDNGSYTLF